MSKNSCIAAEKHRRCVLRMVRAELLLIYKEILRKRFYLGGICVITK